MLPNMVKLLQICSMLAFEPFIPHDRSLKINTASGSPFQTTKASIEHLVYTAIRDIGTECSSVRLGYWIRRPAV